MRLVSTLPPLLLLSMIGCRGPTPGEIDVDEDGYFADVDCNDEDSAIHPDAVDICDGVDNNCDGRIDNIAEGLGTLFYADGDGDSFGSDNSTLEACDMPAGYVTVGGDCNDSSAAIYPDAPETDCTDDTDYNCDGSVGFADADGDGFAACEDCDDTNAQRSPLATELCNGVDDDCDASTDEDAADAPTWYADADADGFGDANATTTACEAPAGALSDDTDCDDAAAEIHPGADERCNTLDDNCNGLVDEEAVDAPTWFADVDGDGFAGDQVTTTACSAPAGHLATAEDCNDLAATAFPGGTEVCDNLDNNCDGSVDNDATDAPTWYTDADDDGYGDPALATMSCAQPTQTVVRAGDCDDAVATTHPGGTEVCDGADNDCDGGVDLNAVNPKTWYADTDADGFGDVASPVLACDQAPGTVADATDCDDTVDAIHPGGTEVCNGLDDDCNGNIDGDATDAPTWYADLDKDGHGGSTTAVACVAPAGHLGASDDCDDLNAKAYPGASEVCDGADNDCDTFVDEDATDAPTWYADADDDGYGDGAVSTQSCAQPSNTVARSGDCDDNNATAHPGAVEVCDGADNDCDTLTDEEAVDRKTWYADADNDTFGDAAVSTLACSAPSAYVANATDCDDTAGTVHPGGTEVCNSVDDNCNQIIDDNATDATTWYADIDGDGHAGTNSTVVACSAPQGHLSAADDCDDLSTAVFPGADEVCDGQDNDCDQDIDGGAIDAPTWYADTDGDGFGDPASSTVTCNAPAATVGNSNDCDDTSNSNYPGAAEVCDGVDNNCNQVVDDAAIDTTPFYLDADGDGFGTNLAAVLACSAPTGFGVGIDDCDDSLDFVHPGAPEVCDTYDNDCDGGVDVNAIDESTFYVDTDGDTYGDETQPVVQCFLSPGLAANFGDCDLGNPNAYPGAPPSCDFSDLDCDGVPDGDQDMDGFLAASCGGNDCDDTDPTVYPGVNGCSGHATVTFSPTATYNTGACTSSGGGSVSWANLGSMPWKDCVLAASERSAMLSANAYSSQIGWTTHRNGANALYVTGNWSVSAAAAITSSQPCIIGRDARATSTTTPALTQTVTKDGMVWKYMDLGAMYYDQCQLAAPVIGLAPSQHRWSVKRPFFPVDVRVRRLIDEVVPKLASERTT